MLTELARRGIAHPNTAAFVKRAVLATDQGDGEKIELSTWGIVLLYVSFFVAMWSVVLVSYMLQQVVATLCMVETPSAAITVSPSTHEPADKEENERLLEIGPTITLIHQKPITSSIRGTIKHLVANAGRFARFRGFRIYLLYSLCTGIVCQCLAAPLAGVLPVAPILVAGLTGALLANLHASWTHKVISMPTNKTFWQRIPARSQWKTLALPAAIEATMPYVSMYLMYGTAMLMGLTNLNPDIVREYDGVASAFLIIRFIILFVLAICCALFLCLPAMVTLVRIEASILPEDQDTIVPFDRSFGGKCVSELHGGSGKVGFLDAWRSFNWEARRRLLKLFFKSALIVGGLVFIVAHVLVAEVFVVFGPALGKFLAQAKREGWVQ